jgi:DNA-binding NtrC family response regulator
VSIPRILVIDDQLGTDDDLRADFLADTNCIELGFDAVEPDIDHNAPRQPLAAVTFCRGQEVSEGFVENCYREIKKAVKKRWNDAKRWSLVLLDAMFVSGPLDGALVSGQDADERFGEQIRQDLGRDFPELPVAMLTSKPQSEMQTQDAAYLSKKNLSPHELARALVQHGRLTREQQKAVLRIPQSLTVASDAMMKVFLRAFLCAPTNANVLLLGETGVGKEETARYIVTLSPRASHPFVAMNVAAITETLIESELFGHEKGAFTGATERRPGAFERASGGTLFLDEIGDMSPSMQSKILRASQERRIERVGGKETIPVDIRLISATHQDLTAKISDGTFREDLLYRVNTFSIDIPPLRERPDDIVAMAEAFLATLQAEFGKRGISLSPGAKARLQEYGFPGNVRELRNIIEGLVIQKGSYTVVDADDLPAHLRKQHVRPSKGAEPRAVVLTKASADGSIALSDLADALLTLPIDARDPALQGALTRLNSAYRELLKRLAGAALQSTKDRRTGALNRTEAMGHLKGEPGLTPTAAKRDLNEILGRNRTAELSDDDILALVKLWEEGAG